MGWLALVLIVAASRLANFWGAPVPFDAEHEYLPAAKRLLVEGAAFFLDPESYRIAPLAYIWPALWQLDQHAIRLANGALYLASAAMLWRTADLLGGTRAALLTAGLFVFHPELPQYFAAEWTEPFYVAGLSALFLASAELILGARNPGRWMALGASGLAMTLLGRPALQLMAPAMLLGCLIVAWWPSSRRATAGHVARQLALMIALGLLPALIVVVKNGLQFGLWGIATGSGTGLYLGFHPISQGTEPAYYGLTYDVNLMASLIPGTKGDHLSLAGDRFLREVAIETLKTYNWPERLAFLARKLGWWLFHHPVALTAQGNELRGIRVFELLSVMGAGLALAGLWLHQGKLRVFRQFAPANMSNTAAEAIGLRRAIAAGLLLLGMLGLLGQLLPVLYNSRYSTGLLGPWLCVLTGVAWTLMSRFLVVEKVGDSVGMRWTFSARGAHSAAISAKVAALALIVAFTFFFAHPRRIEHVSMDRLPASMPITVLAQVDTRAGIESTNIARVDSTSWRLLEQPGALVFPMEPALSIVSQPHANDLWRLHFAVRPPKGNKCRHAEVGFTSPQGARERVSPLLYVAEDGKMHEYIIHATRDLRPAGPGDLRIAYHCPAGTIVTWGGGEMIRPEILERWRWLATRVGPNEEKVH